MLDMKNCFFFNPTTKKHVQIFLACPPPAEKIDVGHEKMVSFNPTKKKARTHFFGVGRFGVSGSF